MKFERCRYITLTEMKEMALRRIRFSYESVKNKIDYGWNIDSNYMIVANNPLMRKLERIVLELGVRKPTSLMWDLTSLIAYASAAAYAKRRRKEYQDRILKEIL